MQQCKHFNRTSIAHGRPKPSVPNIQQPLSRHEAQIKELRHLFPHFANEELAQARDDLEQYLLHALRVFDRLEAESKMASLTQTDHDHYDSIKVED